jgi:hypothetical protein
MARVGLRTGAYASASRLFLRGLGDDLDDPHHPLVLVVNRVTVIDETPDDHRIGKRDHHPEHAWPRICGWRYREGVSQTILVLPDPIDLSYQERRLMDMEAVILLISVDDGPLFGITLAPRSMQFRDTRHRLSQIGDQSVGDGVAPAVHGYVRALLPGL